MLSLGVALEIFDFAGDAIVFSKVLEGLVGSLTISAQTLNPKNPKP